MSIGGGTERLITAALRRSADRRGLSFETLGFGWVVRLSDDDRARHVIGYDFELNTATAAKIAGDKAATASLLEAAGIPAVEHRLFLRPDVAPSGITGNDRAAMVEFAADHGWDLVCKSNVGTGGGNMYRVRMEEELDEAVAAVFAVHHAAALSPYLEFSGEYRVVVLDTDPRLVYEKVAAPGEWRHNLGRGGRAVDVTDDVKRSRFAGLAARAMGALALRFGSVDIVEAADTVAVLEVNAGVMMENYGRSSDERLSRAYDIYDQAVAAMFA